jgi:hypothetical protein
MTGEYADEAEPAGEPIVRSPHATAWAEHAIAAILVPVGIVMGALLAASLVARLLALPFVALSRTSSRRPE